MNSNNYIAKQGRLQTPGEWYSSRPPHRFSVADVTANLYDAAVSGSFVSLLTGSLLAYIDAPIKYAPFFGLSCAFYVYRDGIKRARSPMEEVENFVSFDAPEKTDGDDAPPPVEETIRVEVREGSRWQFAHLGEKGKLTAFAKFVSANMTFSERTAVKAGLSQEEWSALRDTFISKGWAEWSSKKSRKVGARLTRAGQSVFRGIGADAHVGMGQDVPEPFMNNKNGAG